MTASPSTAVLLAAGRARRLGELTRRLPKCLLEVGGRSLVERQVDLLRDAGVAEIVVVTGFEEEQVRRALGEEIRYVHNPRFDETNSLYSLDLALETFEGPFFCMNADVLFHPRLLDRLLEVEADSALLYEPARRLGHEEMKVRIEDGRVVAMAKDLPDGTYHGENLGLLRFGPEGAPLVRRAARELVRAGEHGAWAPLAFAEAARRIPLRAVSTDGLPWIEIDFPEDLERARRVVWPAIAGQAEEGRSASGL